MKIYTKTGDQGETGLFGGRRVPKDDLRVETYGEVDELNAALGSVLAVAPKGRIREIVEPIQSLLFELGAELATPPDKKQRSSGVTHEDVMVLERAIDELDATLAPLKTFVLPAGSDLATRLHLARAVCRRAERRLVTLRREEPQTSEITVVFLNRLSDLLFVLARAANGTDVPWQPRAPRR
jgi:cob(I)alamin adenosyltransferase